MTNKQIEHFQRKWMKILKRHLQCNKRERELGINTLLLKGRLPA